MEKESLRLDLDFRKHVNRSRNINREQHLNHNEIPLASFKHLNDPLNPPSKPGLKQYHHPLINPLQSRLNQQLPNRAFPIQTFYPPNKSSPRFGSILRQRAGVWLFENQGAIGLYCYESAWW